MASDTQVFTTILEGCTEKIFNKNKDPARPFEQAELLEEESVNGSLQSLDPKATSQSQYVCTKTDLEMIGSSGVAKTCSGVLKSKCCFVTGSVEFELELHIDAY